MKFILLFVLFSFSVYGELNSDFEVVWRKMYVVYEYKTTKTYLSSFGNGSVFYLSFLKDKNGVQEAYISRYRHTYAKKIQLHNSKEKLQVYFDKNSDSYWFESILVDKYFLQSLISLIGDDVHSTKFSLDSLAGKKLKFDFENEGISNNVYVSYSKQQKFSGSEIGGRKFSGKMYFWHMLD